MTEHLIPVVSHAEFTLENIPLLSRLRDKTLMTNAEVCIERARYVTEYLKKQDAEQKDVPQILKYARAVRYFLSRKAPLFFDDNLLAGTTTSKPFGAPVYPELTGLTIWPELDTMSTRKSNPQILSRKDADELNLEIFPYWLDRTILEETRSRFGNTQAMQLMSRIVFFIGSKAGTISHTVPSYGVALEKGLLRMIEEAKEKEDLLREGDQIPDNVEQSIAFYQAVQEVLKGVITYAENLSSMARTMACDDKTPEPRRLLLNSLADVCTQVPARPARTFREALNAVWLLQVAIHAENINMAISPGRLDQLLYPYYRRDMDEGTMTDREALELIGCFWLKLNDNTNLVPETAEELFGGAGTVPAVTLGGITPAGDDGVNELTYLMLRVTELLKTRDPSVNARYHRGINSRDYLHRVAEVVASTKAIPAFYNDEMAIRTLENQGVSLEHARDYAIIGCVELSASGRSYDASSSVMFNLVSALELALFNGKRPITGDEQIGPQTGDPSAFQNFADFWLAYKKQVSWIISQAVELNEQMGKTHQACLPTPLLSSLFEGPMDNGCDLIFGGALYNSSGATHIGFADTVDSLSAIQGAVFADKVCSFAELIQALKDDFKNAEKLHAYLLHKTPKFGTDQEEALENARSLIDFLYETWQGYTNYRGGKYRPAYWTMTNHAGQGKLTGALPNGRRAYRLLASGITPVSQAAPELTSCLNAVAALDPLHIPGGVALNMKYPAVNDLDDLERFAGAIEGYFSQGGLHIQFNIMSYEMLIDAKEHPEKYPDLLVRVSGYSAYFKDLTPTMKEEIITRTAYALKDGRASNFPEKYSSMLPFSEGK